MIIDATTLPIGTVVTINGTNEPLMIVNHCPVTAREDKEGYFDFGSVMLPVGLTDQNLIFFNKEDIQEVLFFGYIDRRFQEFISNYKESVDSIPFTRFTIADFKD